MYKGIVFDLDGTLVDSPLCFKTIRKELEIPENEFILEYLETLPSTAKAERHARLEKIELEVAKLATPIPGAINLLNRLQNAGIRTGIFTRNCKSVTDYVAKNLGINVHKTLTREDGPPKPDPTGLRNFLSEWNLNAPELLFVGDFKFDIECGKRAGVKTALFTNGQQSLNDWQPDHIISDYSVFWENLGLRCL